MFFKPERVNNEIAINQADRDTIVSAQTETASLVYGQYGDEENIWSLPQVVVLPFEVENDTFFKPIFSDGCDKLYSKLSVESEANGGTFPDNAVHQMYTFLSFIAVGTKKALWGSNKIDEQVNISPTRHWVPSDGNLHSLFLGGGRMSIKGEIAWHHLIAMDL